MAPVPLTQALARSQLGPMQSLWNPDPDATSLQENTPKIKLFRGSMPSDPLVGNAFGTLPLPPPPASKYLPTPMRAGIAKGVNYLFGKAVAYTASKLRGSGFQSACRRSQWLYI